MPQYLKHTGWGLWFQIRSFQWETVGADIQERSTKLLIQIDPSIRTLEGGL